MSSQDAFKECQAGRADLDAEDPDVVDQMVSYMYNLAYSTPTSYTSTLLFHVRIFIIADKYNIPHLAKDVIIKFKDAATKFEEVDHAGNNIADLATAVDEAYSVDTGTREMRQAIVPVVCSALVGSRKRPLDPHFGAVIVHRPMFSVDLVSALREHCIGSPFKWFQHDTCDPFAAEILDIHSDTPVRCPDCGEKHNGSEWTTHYTVPNP